jgi:hypothetical protein
MTVLSVTLGSDVAPMTVPSRLGPPFLPLVLMLGEGQCGAWGERRRRTMLNRIRAALGRVWRPRRRTGEHGFQDQGEARRYRDQQFGEEARGQSYQPPSGPTPI